MGFNTTVIILNDALRSIEEDPNFGKKLVAAILKKSVQDKQIYVSASNHANAATVIETHHADQLHAILVGGNTGEDLGYVGGYAMDVAIKDGKEAFLKQVARNLGLEVSIRKGKK